MKIEPNIFEYATKELTQDAIFCYILDCFNYPHKRIIAKDFLKLIEFDEIDKITEISIKRQEDHSDIKAYISFEHRNPKIILIEDKIFTSTHDNQLERYKNDTANRHKLNKEDITGIFFKIGKPTIHEITDCEKANFKILDYIKFAEYIKSISEKDNLLKMFSEFFDNRVSLCRKIDDLNFDFIDDLTLIEILNDRYGLRKFTEWLLKQIFKDTKYEYNIKKQYDVNNYGRPCTQYTFIFNNDRNIEKIENWELSVKDFPTSECNCFFRIDKNKNGWYISIRRYYHNKANKNQLDNHNNMRTELLQKLGEVNDDSPNKKAKKELNLLLYNFSSIDKTKELIPIFKEAVNYLFAKTRNL